MFEDALLECVWSVNCIIFQSACIMSIPYNFSPLLLVWLHGEYTTYLVIHWYTSLQLQSLVCHVKILLGYVWPSPSNNNNNNIMNMNMNKMANFSFGWNSHTAFFLLDTYKGTYHCKEVLKGNFKLKDAF